MDIDALVDRFLAWPVPASVYPDGTPGKPGRTGTNLLSAVEAREMLVYVLGPAALNRTPSPAKYLLQDAKHEIERLRRANEMLNAKVEVMEIFATALLGRKPEPGMAPDVAWALDKAIRELDGPASDEANRLR